MSLNIVTKKEVITIDGTPHNVVKPTVRMANDFQASRKGVGEDEQLPIFVEFLAKCGIPEDVLYDLDMEQFTALADHMVGSHGKK